MKAALLKPLAPAAPVTRLSAARGSLSSRPSGRPLARPVINPAADLKADHLVNARLLAARRANPLGRYAAFPDRWRDFLRAFFVDAGEVAGFFKVSEKAALKWWQGIGGPNGAKLDYALAELPGAREFLYGRG